MGNYYTKGIGIAVDAAGSAYVTGETGDPTFLTEPFAFQASLGGGCVVEECAQNAFVTKLSVPSTSLSIAKTHTDAFSQGQMGAIYTLTVSNNGPAATSGRVAVVETVPLGLTLVSMSGAGWTCPGTAANNCTRSDALSAGTSYLPITVEVNVAANAPGSVRNQAAVVGGGSGEASASDLTEVLPVPLLTVTKTHVGSFTAGQTGATYTVTVNNVASGPTSGTVTVTENVPAGLSLVSMAGTGWTCPGTAANNCTRGDTLAVGFSYPVITVTVNVAANATSPQVNSVGVSGGGSAGASTTDSTTILGSPPILSIAKSHTGNFTQGQAGATYTVTVSNAVGAATTSGTVTVAENVPAGLNLLSMAGAGWTCASGNTCTRSDALKGGSSYPPISVTVSVAASATSPQVNSVSVSGGGSATANASDSTTIGTTSTYSVYDYTGNDFTAVFGSPGVSTSNFVSAALIFSSPLPANFSGDPGGLPANNLTPKDQILPSSWWISDGVHTYSSAAGSILNDLVLGTDSNGSINSWHVIGCDPSGCNNGDLITASNDPAQPGYVWDLYGFQYTGTSGAQASVQGNPGTWTSTSTTVPQSDSFCPGGANGPGGIYSPTTSSCSNGVAVPEGDSFCPAGANGPGAIYNPTSSTCSGGVAVPNGGSFCAAGSNGPGAIYNPATSTCNNGVAVPTGMSICPLAASGVSLYDPTTSSCSVGTIVPLPDAYCPAGANGPGGIYNPTNGGSCNNGAVVPNQPLPPPVPPSQTTTTASGLTYSRATQTYNGTVTVHNTTSSAVKGSFEILFTGIPSGVTLVNATGSVAGTPYLTVPGVASLAAGQSATVSVQFKDPSNVTIQFTPVIYSGTLSPPPVPPGDSFCQAGAYGAGAPYDPSTATCDNGVVVPTGELYCPPGSYGSGGLYDPSNGSTCDKGVVLPSGDFYCPPGSYGAGYVFNPTQGATCTNGIVVPPGDSYCPRGIDGPGGLYNSSNSYCFFGVPVPNGYSYCVPGSKGPGGIYDSANGGSCSFGRVTYTGGIY